MRLEISTVRYRTDSAHAPSFLATADLQGRERGGENRLLGEVLADEIETLMDIGDLPELDLCLLCGDFYDYPDLRKLGGTGDVAPAINALSYVAERTFFVLGNHDEVNVSELEPEITVLDGDAVNTDTFSVGGVSGIVGNPRRHNRKTEQEFIDAVDLCCAWDVDLMLMHQGPVGDRKDTRGMVEINQVLRKYSDMLVLFGHCHWPEDPFCKEGSNLYCNVDARALVFIPEDER